MRGTDLQGSSLAERDEFTSDTSSTGSEERSGETKRQQQGTFFLRTRFSVEDHHLGEEFTQSQPYFCCVRRTHL